MEMKYLITYGYDDRGRIYLDNFLPIPEDEIHIWQIYDLLGDDPPTELQNSLSELSQALDMIRIRQRVQQTRALVLTSQSPLDRETVEAWLKVASGRFLERKSFYL